MSGEIMKQWTKTMIWAFLILYILTGCASKELREFKNDKDHQREIAEEIVRIGEKKYNIELTIDPDELRYNFNMGFPSIREDSLLMPVKTTGEPVYSFDAKIELDNQGDDPIKIKDFDLERSYDGLDGLGEYLIHHIYIERYAETLTELVAYDDRITITDIDINALTSYHFDDQKEKERLIKKIIEDYNSGHFTNPEMFDILYDRYVPKWDSTKQEAYLPSISISITGTLYEGKKFDKVTMKKASAFLKNKIIQNKKFPPAQYFIHSSNTLEDTTEEENYLILVRKTK